MIATRTLARYIGMRFCVMIAGAFLLCAGLIYLVDFIEILRQSGKFGGAGLHVVAWITLLRLPAYTEMVLPFAVLVGTIAAFLSLSRTSELTVVRAGGVSVWQFLAPGIWIALVLGLAAVGLYNPIAADARAEADRLRAEVFGRDRSLVDTKAGAWLRQDSVDGQSILNARFTAEDGLLLSRVTILRYDRDHHFVERIDARQARLKRGYWEMRDAWISRSGTRTEHYDRYALATHLTRAQVTNTLGKVVAVSFWKLPETIELVRKAGLSANRYTVQYAQLLARPAMLAVMVILGATVSLRAFRFGRIQTMIIVGLVAGFGFFILVEISRQIGVAGLASPHLTAWVPLAVACFLSVTALLHLEDG